MNSFHHQQLNWYIHKSYLNWQKYWNC